MIIVHACPLGKGGFPLLQGSRASRRFFKNKQNPTREKDICYVYILWLQYPNNNLIASYCIIGCLHLSILNLSPPIFTSALFSLKKPSDMHPQVGTKDHVCNVSGQTLFPAYNVGPCFSAQHDQILDFQRGEPMIIPLKDGNAVVFLWHILWF